MPKIEDYFLIGDLQTAALVSQGGAIDWMCLPYFDSESIFAQILNKNCGTFEIDTKDLEVSSQYVENTAIVEHTFSKDENTCTVKDFMLPKEVKECKTQLLVRKIEGKKGLMRLSFRFDPKPNYGEEDADIHIDDTRIIFSDRSGRYILTLPMGTAISQNAGGITLRITVAKHETKQLFFEFIKRGELSLNPNRDYEKEVTKFWNAWVKKGTFIDFCREKMIRSAITLKLMQFYPTGGIIAAPTTSLPEEINGERNWDYRYVWVRDATFILYGLYTAGYHEEAKKFFDFIENVTEFDRKLGKELHLMYTIHGDRIPEERTLTHMEKHDGVNPVRIGNGARDQLQIDTYGTLIDAYYFLNKTGMALSDSNKSIIKYLLARIERVWSESDNGIWEVRSGRKHFTYSKVMCWLGVNRALKMQDELGLSEAELARYQNLEKKIKNWIWEHCFDEKTTTLKQHPDTDHMDATNFLFVLIRFLDKNDPETKAIIKKTAEELAYKDVFVYRYFSEDGLSGHEGAFIICSFWYISATALVGKGQKALALFRKLESYMNAQGLLPEEIDIDSGRYLGNYPQAFSHLGFIFTARYINRALEKAKKQSATQ